MQHHASFALLVSVLYSSTKYWWNNWITLSSVVFLPFWTTAVVNTLKGFISGFLYINCHEERESLLIKWGQIFTRSLFWDGFISLLSVLSNRSQYMLVKVTELMSLVLCWASSICSFIRCFTLSAFRMHVNALGIWTVPPTKLLIFLRCSNLLAYLGTQSTLYNICRSPIHTNTFF